MRKKLWTRLAAAAAAGMLALSSFPVNAAAEALEEAAEEATEEEAGEMELPEEGDEISGYEVTAVRRFDLMDADLVLLRHQKSGAQVMLIKNDDLNRAFNIGFRTPVTDNMGTPHVFEHATLSGSEKYPMDIFFNMSYQTYATNMNASTYQFMTMYPIASLSEAQLLSYTDWYMDSCFHPLIMEDPYPFSTEAWRYELQDKDAELTLNGTVYSEMLGVMDADAYANYYFMRSMFPGSTYSTESGGLPEEIPNLTWEKICEFHDTYYVPSNSLACLYGDIEDYEPFLELLSSYYDEYDDTPVEITDPEYVPVTEPVRSSFSVGVEEGSPVDNSSYVYYGVLTGLTDPDDGHRLDVIGSLLGSGTGRLAVALEKEYPEAEMNVFCGTDGPEYYMAFMFDHVNPEDADRLVELVNESLQAASEEGFPEEEVEMIVRSLERETKLIAEDTEIGFNQVPNFNYWWAVDGNPFRYADEVEALYHYQEYMDDGSALELMKSAVMESTRTVLAVTEPVPGLKEQQDAELADKLAEIKASMSEEEIEQIVEETAARNAGVEKDSSQYISELTAVTVDELPEEIREYDVQDETDPETGVRWMSAEAEADGIGTSRIMLDLSGVPQDEINWVNLYVNLLGCLDTENYTKEALAQQLALNCSSSLVDLFGLRTETDEAGYRPVLRLSTVSLTEETEELYRLLYEYVFRMKVDDTDAIRSYTAATITQLRDRWNSQPYSMQVYRAEGASDERMAYISYLSGFEYVDFLRKVLVMLDEEPETVTQELAGAAEYLNNAAGAVIMSAGQDSYIEVSEQAAADFLGQLEQKEYEPQDYQFTAPAMAEGITIDSNVQYNLLYAGYETMGLEEYTGDLDVLTSIISDGYLYPVLRDTYGAYGVLHGADDTGIYVVSYRDPQVEETFGTYASLADVAESLADLDEETLDGYKMNAYAGYAMPGGELTGAVNAIATELRGDRQEDTLDDMRAIKEVTAEDLAGYAMAYAAMIDKGLTSTTASGSVLKANEQLYDVILAPFANTAGSPDEELITESVTE